MAFKDVKQDYSVYILDKQNMTITDGKVLNVGFPHLDINNKPQLGQSLMVIDITILSNGKTATYTIPENLSITYAGNLVLSTDKQGLICEVEASKTLAEKIIESIPKQKEIVEKATTLLADLNPIYKERKLTEERFNKMEDSINRLESVVNNFVNSFKNGQGNSNTTQ